jgi:hypothetical protein
MTKPPPRTEFRGGFATKFGGRNVISWRRHQISAHETKRLHARSHSRIWGGASLLSLGDTAFVKSGQIRYPGDFRLDVATNRAVGVDLVYGIRNGRFRQHQTAAPSRHSEPLGARRIP